MFNHDYVTTAYFWVWSFGAVYGQVITYEFINGKTLHFGLGDFDPSDDPLRIMKRYWVLILSLALQAIALFGVYREEILK